MKRYVAYFRVSTAKQGVSGLGLDSQKNIVKTFCKDAEIISEFMEVESGKKNNRVELDKAISYAKKHDAILLIAKLDRLSRNLTFISTLMDNKVKFVCCDMPTATEFTIHIFAALAEQERKLISSRTKAALAELKSRGVKLGTNNITSDIQKKGVETIKANAKHANRHACEMVRLYATQGLNFQAIANKLNGLDMVTRNGKPFAYNTVKRLYQTTLV